MGEYIEHYERPFTVIQNGIVRKINDLGIVFFLHKQARKNGERIEANDCRGKEIVFS